MLESFLLLLFLSETFDPMELPGKEFSSTAAELSCVASDLNSIADVGGLFNLTFNIVDKNTLNPVKNISWRVNY